MRTAVFYSCKGGSGRTLTLVNVASLLVRLGFDVLVIDLDLEAPGVPEALDMQAKTNDKSGFVEYARDWLETLPTTPASWPTLQIIELEQRSTHTGRSDRGPRLRMIRAGDYDTPAAYDNYAEFMWQGALESLYPLPGQSGASRHSTDDKTKAYVENYTSFWRSIREQIAADPPDYLLVDTRTGFSPLSAASVDAFLTDLAGEPSTTADLFVFADLGSEASRRGTSSFVRQLRRRLLGSTVPRRTWIVRREQALAQSVDKPDEENLKNWQREPEDWLGYDGGSVEWTSEIEGYFTLSSDPEVELTGERLASPDQKLENRALLDDYVAIAEVLHEEPREADQEKDLGRAPGLREQLKLKRADSYKLFKLPGTGGMYNVADSLPNVSFTERTFHSLVKHLLSEDTLPTDESLAKVGKEAGIEFATRFMERAPENVNERVARWQELESASGWGLFELIPAHVPQFLGVPDPVIRVIHNAFAPPPPSLIHTENSTDEWSEESASTINTSRGDRNLCAFLAGYLSGILSTLTGRRFDIDPTDHEFCRTKRYRFCEFKFTRTDQHFSAPAIAKRKIADKICLIYTGGTIGMQRDPEGKLRPPQDPRDFLRLAPELPEIVDYDFEPLLNKDSTNVVPSDWTAIAKAIYDRRDAGYKGFVVVHGTDTMHFSAAAVAFALGQGLPFPVVFTGAQTIPEVQHGDARINLLRACAVAKLDLAEVVISFGDFVFRGARAQKKDERKFDAFESPAMFPLGEIGEQILLNPAARTREQAAEHEFRLGEDFESGVLQVSLIPGLEPSLLRPAVESEDFKGLILQSFGAGNVPDEDADEYSVIPIIKMAVLLDKPVIVTSQFPANTTQKTDYAPGRKAVEAGAIPTGNMTASCSVAKFRWALSRPKLRALESDPPERLELLRRIMGKSYIGELDEDKANEDELDWDELV